MAVLRSGDNKKPGIRLNIQNDDSVKIDDSYGDKKQKCFGNVKCGWSEHKSVEAILHNGSKIKAQRWYCNKKQAYTAELDECPLKLWQKMAVPIGFQNVFNAEVIHETEI